MPHRLETDPTIVYGCTVPLKKSCRVPEIRRAHRSHPSRWTKKIRTTPTPTRGSPRGPIANPGREALEAVLEPDATPYLFFVSKNDGTHQFSKTKAEHEAAVEKYQRHGGLGT